MSLKFCRRLTLGPGVAVLILSAASTFAANEGGVSTVPPAPLIEKPLTPVSNDTPSEQPSTQHVWVPGHWRWSEGSYVWEMGRWEVPPASNVVWTQPEWQRRCLVDVDDLGRGLRSRRRRSSDDLHRLRRRLSPVAFF